MLEFEKKILLTKKEYEALMKWKDLQTPSFVQINHYYDNDAYAMNQLGITCRIREKGGTFTATMKAHQGEGTDCSIEHSMTALHKKDDRLFKHMNVTYQGSLKTFRTVLWQEEGFEGVLDKNEYLSVTDYELELEYSPDKKIFAEQTLAWLEENLLSEGNIRNGWTREDRIAPSKSERFFAVKKKTAEQKQKYS